MNLPSANAAIRRDGITPFVLTGGRSRRFGRDKLAEPIERADPASRGDVSPAREPMLVDRPLSILRQVFGPPVRAVGACAPRVASRFEQVIRDSFPDAGPIGGVLSALEACGTDVFVLAGDLPRIDAHTVELIVRAAAGEVSATAPGSVGSHGALAVLASGKPGSFEPCVGVYRAAAAPLLRERITSGRFALREAIPAERCLIVPVSPEALANVNRPEDLVAVYARMDRVGDEPAPVKGEPSRLTRGPDA
ncbi:MAG: molybdenum cofactor guanylyltransferase [Phycisphaerales bacterium]